MLSSDNLRFSVLAVLLIFLLASCSSRDEESGIETTLLWARLEPLPSSSTEVDLVVSGSSMTREFNLTFIADKGDIENWLLASDGTKDVVPLEMNSKNQLFKIEPGGGAQFAELEVDWMTGTVKIHTFWS